MDDVVALKVFRLHHVRKQGLIECFQRSVHTIGLAHHRRIRPLRCQANFSMFHKLHQLRKIWQRALGRFVLKKDLSKKKGGHENEWQDGI